MDSVAQTKRSASLSVVIPAYNESHRLPQTLAEIRPFLDSRFESYEILVVDDGSSDHTPAMVERLSKEGWPNLRVLCQGKNIGKGAAVRRGCLEAQSDLILFMDADHAVPIAEVERFIDDVDRHKCGAVVGVRTYQEHESKWRRIVGLSLQILTHLIVFKKAVVDSQCGFKLFTRDTVQKIFPLCRIDGGMIDVELFYLMHLHGISCFFESVHWDNKAGSRINFVRCMLFDPFDMIKIRLWDLMRLYSKPSSRRVQPWSPQLEPRV